MKDVGEFVLVGIDTIIQVTIAFAVPLIIGSFFVGRLFNRQESLDRRTEGIEGSHGEIRTELYTLANTVNRLTGYIDRTKEGK